MDGLVEILPAILDRGLPAALLVVPTWFLFRLANDAAGILAETYTKPVADTAARTLANWIVVIAAIVMSRWTPGTVEALKVQLEYLDHYQDDGSAGFKLIRQAVDFALFRMHSTAKAEDTILAERQPSDPAESSVTMSDHPLLQDRARLEAILDVMYIQVRKVTHPFMATVGREDAEAHHEHASIGGESPDNVLQRAALALLSYPPSQLITTWEALAVGIARNKAKDAIRRASS